MVVDVGAKLSLDAPNDAATVTIVPITFMPIEQMKRVMVAVKAMQDAKIDDRDPVAAMEAFEYIRPVLPDIVYEWTLMNPAEPDKKLLLEQFNKLPMMIIEEILAGVTGDVGEIPLVKGSPSETSSSDIPIENESLMESNGSGELQPPMDNSQNLPPLSIVQVPEASYP
jgi:hypothetical protein